MKTTLFTLLIACSITACNSSSTEKEETKKETVDMLGTWTSRLDLSECDTADMMIKQLQKVVDVTKSQYIFNANGKGESLVYVNDSLQDQNSFEWTQNGDTVFTTNEFSANLFIITSPSHMENNEFKDNPQKVRHYLER